MKQKQKKLWVLLLTAALTVTQFPTAALAESSPPEDGAVTSFESLDSDIANQTVPTGTQLAELNLPDTVKAEVCHVTEEQVPVEDDSAASSGGAAGSVSDNDTAARVKTVTTVTTSTENIFVTWNSDPVYDGDTAGSYVFTADVGGCALADGVNPPHITVTVKDDSQDGAEETTPDDATESIPESQPEEPKPCTLTEGCTLPDGHEGGCMPELPTVDNALVKTITGWVFVDDDNLNEGELSFPGVSAEHQAKFDDVTGMLPKKIHAEIEDGEPENIRLEGWTCEAFTQDNDDNWPVTGDYTFTAELPEGYALAPDAEAVEVPVTLGGGTVYSTDGEGYSFDSDTGRLTVSSSDGTTGWQKDPDIDPAEVLYVTMEEGVTKILDGAYSGCENLIWVVFLQSAEPEVGNNCFPRKSKDWYFLHGLYSTEWHIKYPVTIPGMSGTESPLYSLGIENGTLLKKSEYYVDSAGINYYPHGAKVPVRAEIPQGKVFDHWSTAPGNRGGFEDAWSASTVYTFDQYNVVLKPSYIDGYQLTVKNGTDETGSELYAAGWTVKIKAGAAPTGQIFDHWEAPDGGTFADPNSEETEFTMPVGNATVIAYYKNDGYQLTVVDGTDMTGRHYYHEGDKVRIKANDAPVSLVFSYWETSDGGSFTDLYSAETEFVMPAKDVTVTAKYMDPAATTLTLTVDDNSANIEDIINAALLSVDWGKITTIKVVGEATEITGNNWRSLLSPYVDGNGLDRLTTLDLSQMKKLTKLGDVSGSYYRRKLKRVNLPDNLQIIGGKAFRQCSNLADINWPHGLQRIEGLAFTSTSITLTNLPDSLQYIDSNAFANCNNIVSAELPANLQYMGEAAFFRCENLVSMKLPASLQTMAGYIFNGCSSLETVVFLGKKAPSIADETFLGIPPATNIYVPRGATGYESLNTITIEPVITVQPQDAAVPVGDTATFAVEATGLTLEYQWQVNKGSGWENVADGTGGDTASYTTPATGPSMNGWQYQCIIKNSWDSETTNAVSLFAKTSPALSLKADPESGAAFPEAVTLTATLTGAIPNDLNKEISFTIDGKTQTATTNASGKASCTVNLMPGTYNFSASFKGDTDNLPVTAKEVSNYSVGLGTQDTLSLIGLKSTYTYGDSACKLSTSGGSGSGMVSYISSDSSVASVTGDTVTIQKAGKFVITATKEGDSKYKPATVTSGEITVVPATPDMSITVKGGSTTSDPITLIAEVAKVGTGATPTGSVVFTQDNIALATGVFLDGSGTASLPIGNPDAGSHTYMAVYSGQTGFYKESRVSRKVDVALSNQTGFTINAIDTKSYGDKDFILTADGGQSTGGVSFSAPSNNGVLSVETNGTVKIIGAGSVMVTATKAGDSAYNEATATQTVTVLPRDIAKVTVNITGSHIYTGSQLQPIFTVKDGSLAITTGDYTNLYGTNQDAGVNAGSITLTGQHNYTGTKTVQFDIEKRSLSNAVITLAAGSYVYTGQAIEPAITKVEAEGITVPDSAFDITYRDNTAAGTATVTVTAKAGSNFTDSASTTFLITQPDKTSTGGSSGDSSYTPALTNNYQAAGDHISQTISRNDLQGLINNGKSLTLSSDKASLSFNPAALKAILSSVPSTAGSVTFTAAPGTFPDTASLIGLHPVYDFTGSYQDGTGKTIMIQTNLPAGSAHIALKYTPAEGEIPGSLFMVCVDDAGAVTWLNNSSYHNGWMLAEVPFFTSGGVAYKTPAPVFTDTTNHWAKADIEFVAARGLLTGTGNNQFSPDAALTQGMFVTALGRLAGINPDNYKTHSFTDVKADAYYAAYAEWAAQKGILNGTGKSVFSPDEPVTREQMAVMMVNYAKQMGYSIPAPLAEEAFTDNTSISAWAAEEVKAMQRAGIIKGRDGNRFAPQEIATRAEVSAMLHRFVNIILDPATAQGWTKNDSGHLLYYKNGKALTGWQEIGGKWYYFYEDGTMAVNTTIDGYEIGADGIRK